MSPEQARGQPVDKRSDVWAFGCVLYEMLTGRRAFEGETVTDTLAGILKTPPDWSALPADTPSAVVTLLKRCLDKDRGRRVADAATLIYALDPNGTPEETPAPLAGKAPASSRRATWLLAAALAGVLVAGAAVAWLRPSTPPREVARLSLPLPAGVVSIASSPSGRELAYNGPFPEGGLFLRSFDAFEPRAFAPGVGPAVSFAFSPDGRSIAFLSLQENAIMRVDVRGGAALLACSGVDFRLFSGMTWDSSGIVFSMTGDGVFRCSPTTGAVERLLTVAHDEVASSPRLLPDGRGLLLSIATTNGAPRGGDPPGIVVYELASGERKTLVEIGSNAVYVPTGHLLYTRRGTLFAAPFDAPRREVVGEPVPVVEGVLNTGILQDGPQFAASAAGHLYYRQGPSLRTDNPELELVLADRTGALEKLPLPPGRYVDVRASPDGTRLAVGTDDGTEAAISVYRFGGPGALQRLTFGGRNLAPVWSPDGERIAFQSDRDGAAGVYAQRADGNSPAERLTTPGDGETHAPESWSPDGERLLVTVGKGSRYSLHVLSVGDKALAPLGVESTEPIRAVFAPDGRWIAYDQAGRAGDPRGVYVQPFPPTGATYQAPHYGSLQLDFHPVWSSDGTGLLYTPSAGALVFVSVATSGGVTFGTPVELRAAVAGARTAGERRAFDVLSDGGFVGAVDEGTGALAGANAIAPEVRVVLNWFDELERLAPAK
jgi:serine/threonine-protein kinase